MKKTCQERYFIQRYSEWVMRNLYLTKYPTRISLYEISHTCMTVIIHRSCINFSYPEWYDQPITAENGKHCHPLSFCRNIIKRLKRKSLAMLDYHIIMCTVFFYPYKFYIQSNLSYMTMLRTTQTRSHKIVSLLRQVVIWPN